MISIAKIRACWLASTDFARDERGLSTVEYVIVLVLIAAVAMGTWNQFGRDVLTKLEDANDTFNAEVTTED